MKLTTADRIFTLLKEKGPLYDEEISAYLPDVSRNTLRRARRDLVVARRIEPVGYGRIVKHRVVPTAVSGLVVPEQAQDQR